MYFCAHVYIYIYIYIYACMYVCNVCMYVQHVLWALSRSRTDVIQRLQLVVSFFLSFTWTHVRLNPIELSLFTVAHSSHTCCRHNGTRSYRPMSHTSHIALVTEAGLLLSPFVSNSKEFLSVSSTVIHLSMTIPVLLHDASSSPSQRPSLSHVTSSLQ